MHEPNETLSLWCIILVIIMFLCAHHMNIAEVPKFQTKLFDYLENVLSMPHPKIVSTGCQQK